MKKLLLILFFAPFLASAQNDWSQVEVKNNPVEGNISFLTGAGGNIGVLYGPEGIMIIDDQFAPLSGKISETIGTFTEGNLKFVLNTHYHGDHTGGNENFKTAGATLVGHDNVRRRMSEDFKDEIRDRVVEAKPSSFWPVITFSTDLTFYFNNEEVQLIHVASAHTDGDALVHFKTSNVIHAGDAFVRYGYPFIDVAGGGSIDGIIDAQKKILELSNEDTKIIPGHGALATTAEVKELLKMLEETRGIVATAKSGGKALEDLIAEKPFAAYHDRWNGSFINSDLFVQLIYESLP